MPHQYNDQIEIAFTVEENDEGEVMYVALVFERYILERVEFGTPQEVTEWARQGLLRYHEPFVEEDNDE